jgi:hypothetical protein
MMVQKTEVIERSLWNAVSQLEELLDLLQREKPQAPRSAEGLNAEISQRREEIDTQTHIARREGELADIVK